MKLEKFHITRTGQILETVMIVATLYILLNGLIALIAIGIIVMMILSHQTS